MKPSTSLIHHPYVAPGEFEAATVGVHKASTVVFPSVQAMLHRRWKDKSGYTYGLHGTPTTFTLEERLASSEGGRFCVLAPSGLSAITLVNLSFLTTGDEVLMPDNVYGPNKDFALTTLSRWGIQVVFYDPLSVADVAMKLNPRTRLVWVEAPGSVTLEFPDIFGVVNAVKAHNAGMTADQRAVVALDNTWGAGVAFNPFDMGVDISMQALTKFPSGGADVLMGSVVTRDETLHHRLLDMHMHLGLGVGANDAELVLRGLPTLHVRYRQQSETALALAEWLDEHAAVARVLYPALEGSPGHAHWQATGSVWGGCLLTLVFKPAVSRSQVHAFCDALRVFKLGYSWAGPISLAVPYALTGMRSVPQSHWAESPHVVRLAVGLEDADDLQADLAQALSQLV